MGDAPNPLSVEGRERNDGLATIALSLGGEQRCRREHETTPFAALSVAGMPRRYQKWGEPHPVEADKHRALRSPGESRSLDKEPFMSPTCTRDTSEADFRIMAEGVRRVIRSNSDAPEIEWACLTL